MATSLAKLTTAGLHYDVNDDQQVILSCKEANHKVFNPPHEEPAKIGYHQ